MAKCLHCRDLNRQSELFKIASSLKSSVKKVLKLAIQEGQVVASEEEVLKRMQQCYKCEYRMFRDRCKKCGCFLKLKTALKAESCPDNRW